MNESKPVGWCDLCGGELYQGERCYRMDGGRICTDCLEFYARQRFQAALEYV